MLEKNVNYSSYGIPDYSQYVTENRIRAVLGGGKNYAFALNGTRYYENGRLFDGAEGIIAHDENGELTVDSAKMGKLIGVSALHGSTPQAIACSLNMKSTVYDGKLILFYDGDEPLHSFNDMYTLEAMYLHMTGADEAEIVNAFIDLPQKISNNRNNTVFYTAPDLNLGVQTSVYYAQMGQKNKLNTAPALVAGEGNQQENFTTVRVFNNQNACVAQFLAFSPSVKGGVQVAAAKVGEEVLIATAPFADHKGMEGDVRVFDTFGLIRMSICLRDVVPGPHTIVTGRFVGNLSDEVLLVASQTTNDRGELAYAIVSLSDGSVMARYAADFSLALADKKADAPVALSMRRNAEGADTLILYFNSVQRVYEGDAYRSDFADAGIVLPEGAHGVSASCVPGERYTVAMTERGVEDKNLSYVTVYGENDSEGRIVDVGFRENRFYTNMAKEYNSDRYISKGFFAHIRTDFGNKVFLSADKSNVDSLLRTSRYTDYTSYAGDPYAQRLADEYIMLEPCFAHRWNKTPYTTAMIEYADPVTGIRPYASIGKDDVGVDYKELSSTFYVSTYADGILELAKLRMYPLRSFLQTTAVSFRGEGADPEHLIGISPVHEQEINVPGSVGDYNPYMVEGFRRYILNRYGSAEKINGIFGTNFVDGDEIDPPRDNGRGDWDAYGSDYCREWTLYNRYIISKRIMEAYREALLAGYPPEAISAHSIPEGEAVAGFLGEANTRLSPIDVVLTCGTAYGGTRYGLMRRDYNIAYNAKLIGHNNITLGEYGAISKDSEATYNQMKMLWESGVRMLHQMTFGGEFKESEQYAIDKLTEENDLPRPGYTGGTTNSVSVVSEQKSYNVVQIGAGVDRVGLLKSVDADGNWEGTVYLVPFHTKIDVSSIQSLSAPVDGSNNVFSTGNIGRFKNSDQAEITFVASKTGDGSAWVTVEVYQCDCLLGDSTTVYELTDTLTPYRYVLSNQLYSNDLEIRITFHHEKNDGAMDLINLSELRGTLQTETAYFSYFDGKDMVCKGVAHSGGVTFDLLDR